MSIKLSVVEFLDSALGWWNSKTSVLLLFVWELIAKGNGSQPTPAIQMPVTLGIALR